MNCKTTPPLPTIICRKFVSAGSLSCGSSDVLERVGMAARQARGIVTVKHHGVVPPHRSPGYLRRGGVTAVLGLTHAHVGRGGREEKKYAGRGGVVAKKKELWGARWKALMKTWQAQVLVPLTR